MQTLVALLVGESAEAKASGGKATADATDGRAETKDSTQPDASTVLPIAIALPINVHVPEPKASASSELSQVEALLGNASKSPAVTAFVSEALDAAAAKTDSNAQSAAGAQSPFPMTMDALQSASTNAPAPEAASKQLHAPVGTSAWSNELGTHLAWMVDKGHQAASLRLSPEHLGPLEVRIDVRDSQATVWFGATHADTRAALEQSLPRLRELFAAQGMVLNDAGVFREAPRDQSRQSFRSMNGAQLEGDADHAITGVSARVGLLDAYA
jgi:flagellar hook-length control protein FliK